MDYDVDAGSSALGDDVLAFRSRLGFIGLSFSPVTDRPPAPLAYDLCQILLQDVNVDGQFYLTTYPEVAQSISAGRCSSPKDHFIRIGFFEGYKPFQILVDTEFYLSCYPDVHLAIESGQVESTQVHFDLAGWREGRAPSMGFSLLSQPAG